MVGGDGEFVVDNDYRYNLSFVVGNRLDFPYPDGFSVTLMPVGGSNATFLNWCVECNSQSCLFLHSHYFALAPHTPSMRELIQTESHDILSILRDMPVSKFLPAVGTFERVSFELDATAPENAGFVGFPLQVSGEATRITTA